MQEGGKEQAKQKVVVPWSKMAALKMVRNGIYLKHRALCFSHALGVKLKLETIITDEVTGEQSETNLWDTKCESNRIQESEEPVWDWTASGSGMILHLGGSRSKDGDKHYTCGKQPTWTVWWVNRGGITPAIQSQTAECVDGESPGHHGGRDQQVKMAKSEHWGTEPRAQGTS